ncbi:hypothetical protein LOV73_004678 [Salmonella enterica]|nr:hypothetical protein [Salmonella enterica]
MHKRLTITLDDHVVDTSLDDGYRAMSSDKEREVEAAEWCNALSGSRARSSGELEDYH